MSWSTDVDEMLPHEHWLPILIVWLKKYRITYH